MWEKMLERRNDKTDNLFLSNFHLHITVYLLNKQNEIHIPSVIVTIISIITHRSRKIIIDMNVFFINNYYMQLNK